MLSKESISKKLAQKVFNSRFIQSGDAKFNRDFLNGEVFSKVSPKHLLPKDKVKFDALNSKYRKLSDKTTSGASHLNRIDKREFVKANGTTSQRVKKAISKGLESVRAKISSGLNSLTPGTPAVAKVTA